MLGRPGAALPAVLCLLAVPSSGSRGHHPKTEEATHVEDENDMSPMQTILADVQFELGQLESAARKRQPSVREDIGQYAVGVHEEAIFAGDKVSEASEVCGITVHKEVLRMMSTIQSRLKQLAADTERHWPVVQDSVTSFAAAMLNQIELLGTALRGIVEESTGIAEWESDLLNQMKVHFEEIRAAAVDRSSPMVENLDESVSAFSDKVGEIWAKLQLAAVDEQQREDLQATLTVIQDGAGQLVSIAAEKSAPARSAIDKLASASRRKITALSKQILEAVGGCNPDKWRQTRAALDTVVSKAGKLTTALSEHASTVQEGLQDIAADINAEVNHLYNSARKSYHDFNNTEMMERLGELKGSATELLKSSTHVSYEKLAGAARFLYAAAGALYQQAAGLEGRRDVPFWDKRVVMQDCRIRGFKFYPTDMPGQRRTTEPSADACHQRCIEAVGCGHFSYWPNGGCHLQAEDVRLRVAQGVVSGPNACK